MKSFTGTIQKEMPSGCRLGLGSLANRWAFKALESNEMIWREGRRGPRRESLGNLRI
jgi:hypothetical protein